jgi:hypothetical protein
MYVRKEIMNNSLEDRERIKIGPDAVLFKYIEDPLDDHSLFIVKGKIYNVGLDFVEVLQNDDKIVTVKTDRITHVKWPDQKTRELIFDCKHHGHSRCVEFDRMRATNVGKRNRPHRLDKICQNCRRPYRHEDHRKHNCIPCDCDDYYGGHTPCPRCHDEKFEKRRHSQYSYDMRSHDCCHKNFTCFCDHAIPFCDNRFELRLAGLNDDVNFKFLQHKGCHVEIILG